jgi:hypothetical protein
VFFAGGREYMTLVEYKNTRAFRKDRYLVLSYTMSLGLAQVAGYGFLQNADDLVVYVTHRLIEV